MKQKQIFKCSVCSKDFTTNRGRAAHYRMHPNAFVLSPEDAGKAFQEAMDSEYGKMTRELEIKTFEKNGVAVTVKIDYRNNEITLVDPNQNTYAPKQWLFSKRGVEYMQGWKNILASMTNAIERAEAMLRDHNDKKLAISQNNVEQLVRNINKNLGNN